MKTLSLSLLVSLLLAIPCAAQSTKKVLTPAEVKAFVERASKKHRRLRVELKDGTATRCKDLYTIFELWGAYPDPKAFSGEIVAVTDSYFEVKDCSPLGGTVRALVAYDNVAALRAHPKFLSVLRNIGEGTAGISLALANIPVGFVTGGRVLLIDN